MSIWRRASAFALLAIAASCSSPEPEAPRASLSASPRASGELRIETFDVGDGEHPHDVAPAADGGMWYTAQRTGDLGHLDMETGEVHLIDLGDGSSPHGVILGPDDAPWITDTGLNAIVRVDPSSEEIEVFALPDDRPSVGVHTAVFAPDGVLWFTGNNGVFGKLDPDAGDPTVEVFDAPGGAGPYGITATPDGDIYYASLAGSHIARIDTETNEATRIDPPTPEQGARRVWSDSDGTIWVSEWNAGKLGRYVPSGDTWKEWDLPGDNPMAYAVFVDDEDIVWVSDHGGNALHRFDPATEEFTTLEHDEPSAAVRQILGRPGEVLGAESGLDRLFVVRT